MRRKESLRFTLMQFKPIRGNLFTLTSVLSNINSHFKSVETRRCNTSKQFEEREEFFVSQKKELKMMYFSKTWLFVAKN